MYWNTFGKLIMKIVSIVNLIRNTANNLNVSVEQFFSYLDSEYGKEALKTATRIFIEEINRLHKGLEYEVIEASETMTWDEAVAWAASIGNGWRLPLYKDLLNFKEQLSQGEKYWLGQKDASFYSEGYGLIFWKTSSGIGSEDTITKNHVCMIRELPQKTWQLV